MKIIDAHAHIGSLPDISTTRRLILSSMRKYGISYSLISNTDGAEFPSLGDPNPKKLPTLTILKQTIAFHKAHPDRIGALMWIRPMEEQPTKPLIDYIKKHRSDIIGMKFHPYEEQLPIDDPKCNELLAAASDPVAFFRIAGLSENMLTDGVFICKVKACLSAIDRKGIRRAIAELL